jgi:hypothetical protein
MEEAEAGALNGFVGGNENEVVMAGLSEAACGGECIP